MLCGCRSYSAIAQWGRECSCDLAQALGFSVVTASGKERRPGASTLYYALRALDRELLERRLGAWAEEVLACVPPPQEFDGLPELEGVAADGKTLRGSAKMLERATDGRDDVPGVHLLSVVSHRLGITLGQRAVPEKGSEITSMPQFIEDLVLKGKVVTLDALLTQRPIAKAIVSKGGTM
jgi:hypothetical protein